MMAIAIGLAGCAGPVADAPSLAPRAIETIGDVDAPEAVAAVAPADPALTPRIAAIVDQALAAHRAFEADRVKTAVAVGRPGATVQGSDAWLTAQSAVSALQGLRSGVQDAAAALDALRREKQDGAPQDLAALDTAAVGIDALAAQEEAALASLGGRIG